MKIIKYSHDLEMSQPFVVTIGKFDGIHLGHIKLLNKVTDVAKERKFSSIVITFHSSPYHYFNKNSKETDIMTQFDKRKILSGIGIDCLMKIKFDRDFAEISAEMFIEYLVMNLKMKQIVIGHDFVFGKNRLGDIKLLEKLAKIYGFEITKIDAEGNCESIYSSTKLRQYIQNGDIEKINQILGRKYEMTRRIVHGRKFASQLGFPTANMNYGEGFVKLKFGVYLVETMIYGNLHCGIVNIGIKPTIFNDKKPIIELHILDFDGDLYGKMVNIKFISRIRDEMKFANIDELKKRIAEDMTIARFLLKVSCK